MLPSRASITDRTRSPRPLGEPFEARQVQAEENSVAVLHGSCIGPLSQGEYLAGSGLDLGSRVRQRREEHA